jgi:hypothetical protein
MDFFEEVGKWIAVVLVLCVVLIILLLLIKGLFGRFIRNKKIIDAPVGWSSLVGGISMAVLALLVIVAGAILIIKGIF